MKTTTIKRLLPSIAVLALAMIGTSASATSTWNYDLVGQCDPASTTTSSPTLATDGVTAAACNTLTTPVLGLSMTGWSTAPSTLASAQFAAAKIYDWGPTNGLGVVASSESASTTGPHAIDNSLGTDALLLRFTTDVTLNSLKIGWNGSDNNVPNYTGESSDISVLRYTGTTAPVPVMTGNTISGLLSSGWQLVGNYGQVGNLANNTAVITSTVASSWWLISAYNPSYTTVGTPVSSSGLALTAGNDYFKLLSVAGGLKAPPGQTPEPGSLAIAGLALMGLLVSRRRQIQA